LRGENRNGRETAQQSRGTDQDGHATAASGQPSLAVRTEFGGSGAANEHHDETGVAAAARTSSFASTDTNSNVAAAAPTQTVIHNGKP
jgi:hypothetical protein